MIFTRLYDQTLSWAKHPAAPRYLGIMSFAEASFFPIPPDVMLMPMALSRPEKALRYAWIATFWSTMGGVFGYVLGYALFDLLLPWLEAVGYGEKIAQAQGFFDEYGAWVVFIAGFSPIPYKLFTLTAGAMQMPLLPFVIAALLGRGGRFFLVAWLMRIGGARYADQIRRQVEWLGWLFVIVFGAWLAWRML